MNFSLIKKGDFHSRYASEAEYQAFVERHYLKEDTRSLYLKSRAIFVHTYPDLAQWSASPLEELPITGKFGCFLLKGWPPEYIGL